MVKVACFQATTIDVHVVVVVGSECFSSINRKFFCMNKDNILFLSLSFSDKKIELSIFQSYIKQIYI
jgi:hypothetical protein